MDDDRLRTLMERIEVGRSDMPNDEKHWLLDEGLAIFCGEIKTVGYGGPRSNFSTANVPYPMDKMCLTDKGKERLARLKQRNEMKG